MDEDQTSRENPWSQFSGPNLGYINDMYEKYMTDPESVDEDLQQMFREWGAPPVSFGTTSTSQEPLAASPVDHGVDLQKVVTASKLANNIRIYGHLAAKISPFENNLDSHLLELERYGLTKEELQKMPAKVVWRNASDDLNNGLDAIQKLRSIYSRTLSYEFSHVYDIDERDWLNDQVERGFVEHTMSKEQKLELLQNLVEVVGFESFLQKTFVGQNGFLSKVSIFLSLCWIL